MPIYVDNTGIPAFPSGAVMLVVALIFLRKKKHSWSFIFFFSLFWVYIMTVLDIVFFPVYVNGFMVDEMRKIPLTSHIHLVPFYLDRPYPLNDYAYRQIVLNILLTIPFGFGINFISRTTMRRILWLSVAVGLGIELIQLFISLLLQYPYRVIDINDALLNAFGIMVGYGVFRGFAWLYLAMTRKLNIEHKGLSFYIYQVAIQEHVS